MALETVRRSLFAVILVLAALLWAGPAAAKTYWFEQYLKAVERIDAGQAEAAAPLLEEVMQLKPDPDIWVRIPGNQYIDYLPYYQWSRAQALLGNYQEARESLEHSMERAAVRMSQRRHSQELDLLQRAIEDGSPAP